MRVALVYDRVNKWGGAERILLALHELFPDAPLYTSVYNPETAPWASVFDIRTSFLQHFPFASSSHEFYALLMPLAFESFDFSEYDVVISVTSEAAKGIITKPETKHICYLLTPTRYLWSGYEEYFSNVFFRWIASPAISYLRRWDRIAAERPDAYIPISEEVRRRLQRYYNKDGRVIYPPVDLPARRTDPNMPLAERDYLLIVSRLVPYKKLHLAIQACTNRKIPLKVIGVGIEERKLQTMAGPNVEFLGNLTDDELIVYYTGSKGLLFPGLEDFGLTILEAQWFGKPVLAYKGGGALETVINGKTGMFFYPQTVEALEEKLALFMQRQFPPRIASRNARRFGKEVFQKQFKRAFAKLTTNK